jgi:hypothetical protein
LWQVSFFIIATDPPRFRALMLPPALAKFAYAATVDTLCLQRRLNASQLLFGFVDCVLGVLFLLSFYATRRRYGASGESRQH